MPRVTITVPEQSPQPYRFDLSREVVTIGRGSENDIAIACGSVSVRHAEMRRVSRGYVLCDVGSTNGIRLDGELKGEISLKNGLNVRIGDVLFEFDLSDDEASVLAGEPERLPPLPAGSAVREEKPEEKRRETEPSAVVERRGMGAGVLVLLVLVLAAFAAGMAVRYRLDTGHSWWNGLRGGAVAPAAEKQ